MPSISETPGPAGTRRSATIKDLNEPGMTDGLGAVGDSTSLSDADNLYRLLVESARDYAILALDTAGRVLSWNAGAQHLKGYTRDEIVGHHFSVFYPPEDIVAGKPERELTDAQRDGGVEDEGW